MVLLRNFHKMDVNCAPHIIQYFIFGFLFMLFMLDLKCLIRSQSNKFHKKKTQEKHIVELLREKHLFNCHGEIDISDSCIIFVCFV